MCCESCNKSNFLNGHKMASYSGFTDSELKAQCAQENNLDPNDASNKAILDACIKQKKGITNNGSTGEKVLGWITVGSNALSNLSNVLNNVLHPQPMPADYIGGQSQNDQPKGLSTGAIIAIVAGVLLLGGFGYYAFKQSKK